MLHKILDKISTIGTLLVCFTHLEKGKRDIERKSSLFIVLTKKGVWYPPLIIAINSNLIIIS